MLDGADYLWIGLAGLAAGAINALAGGGTLITFPMLTAVGLPAVAANITSTVALSPGYLGAALAQRRELGDQGPRLWRVVPAGLLGGLAGGVLLLQTGERLFTALVPYLILLACALLALQEPVRAWLKARGGPPGGRPSAERWVSVPVGLAAVYGGYFGAGVSVIVLAALGITVDDSLTRLNALKQAVALSANVAAGVFFLFSGQVVWAAALVMAAGALLGGAAGGRLAGRVRPEVLRWTVVGIGTAVALVYLVR